MLTQAYIDAKYADWQKRIPWLADVLRNDLQTRLELEQVDSELRSPEEAKAADQLVHGVPLPLPQEPV